MPGLSLGEILMLALVAIISLKPEDLPRVMRQLGVWTVTVRRYIHGMIAGLEE
jgi:Sec-independent protein translocase protein TatA